MAEIFCTDVTCAFDFQGPGQVVLNCSYLLHSFELKKTSLLPPTCIMCIFCYDWANIMSNKASRPENMKTKYDENMNRPS